MRDRTGLNRWLLRCCFLVLSVSLLAGCGTAGETAPAKDVEAVTAALAAEGETTRVHFIDVGQGDSVLIESAGHFMLVDAGENDQGDVVAAYLKTQNVKKLDYVIGTHPHSDHIGGLDVIIREFPVDKVVLPPREHTTKTFEDVLNAIADQGLKITKPIVGDRYQLGAASFEVIAPNKDYGDDLNNWSVGIKLTHGSRSFVMAGDAEAKAEADMCGNGLNLFADVLKLGHHGSSTSTTEEFFKAVNPSAVVISCGKDNDYGHPHRETMELLARYQPEVYRTDEQGTIVAVTDGEQLEWKTGKMDGIQGGQKSLEGGGSEAAESTEPDRILPKESYVLNTNTKVFHRADCSSVKKMKTDNKKTVAEDREDLISQGYSPCGNCRP